MAIIKQVQIETNGVLNDIGAKYDNAENEIQATYGNNLSLLNGNLKLLAKDDTELASVPLNQTKYLYLSQTNYSEYEVYPDATLTTALTQIEFVNIIEAAIAQGDNVVLKEINSTQEDFTLFRLSYHGVVDASGDENMNAAVPQELVLGAAEDSTGPILNSIYYYSFISSSFGTIYSLSAELEYFSENTDLAILQSDAVIANTISQTLPVRKGGTGATSFTANSIIMSGDSTTSPLVTRSITDNTTNIAISNNNTNIPTMNTIYYGLATVNGNSQHRGLNIYAPTDVTNAVLNDVAVYNSSTGAAEFKTLATTQVNTGYHFEENQTLDSNTTSGVTARVTTTSNNLGVLELSWISLSSDGAATVATGGFTDNTVTAAYADGNVRSW